MALQFKIKLAPAISTAIVLPILMSLGFWQLDRAELKQQTLDRYKARINQPAIRLGSADKPDGMLAADIQYAQLQASGRYNAKRSFLVDNRIHRGQVGFYVLTPFAIDNSNMLILVNRGWVKANQYRTDLPEFSTNSKKISINGQAYVPSKNFFAVDNVKIETDAFPAVIQNIDFAAIVSALNKDVYPFILRLDPKHKTGFVRDWKVITSSAEKSQSYAAQWFTMAFVVVLLFLSSSIKFSREKTA